VSVWVWRGLGIGVFVVICVIFGMIGAAAHPEKPAVGALRMIRMVGIPLALVLIFTVELVLCLRNPQRRDNHQTPRRP
jgi:hypothetical protein